MYRRFEALRNEQDSRRSERREAIPLYGAAASTPLKKVEFPHDSYHDTSGRGQERRAERPPKAQRQEERETKRREPSRENERENARESARENGKGKNPLLSFIPSYVYNAETKKVLGFLSAEDLLLIALILLFLDNEECDDPLLVYALIFVLVSEWIDLSAISDFLPKF